MITTTRQSSSCDVEKPLVSIGIPTYNRAKTLSVALESVICQDYRNLEIIIFDNASEDETSAVCSNYQKIDQRINFYRQAFNCGPINNFVSVLKKATGTYFMWLSDDDWIDSNYISSCLSQLQENRGTTLVGGEVKYYKNSNFVYTAKPTPFMSNNKILRMFSYYKVVDDNGIFYGLMRTAAARKCRMINCMGSDWLFVATIAYHGKIGFCNGTAIHRDLGGTSESIEKLVSILGVPSIQAKIPMTFPLMVNAVFDLFRQKDAYQNIPIFLRFVIAPFLG